jgi:serine protease Do
MTSIACKPPALSFGSISTYCLVVLTLVLSSVPAQAQLEVDSLEVWGLMRRAAERVSESVVQIETLGGLETVDGNFFAAGPATGTIVTPDGLIVTSAYAVVHQPTTILVRFADGNRTTAEIVARDHARGLILLKASNVTNRPVPSVLPESEVRVGQWAVAVGRTFQPDQINTNVGIISAKDRVLGKAIQTDAKVSPNNYGGPLVDVQGRVMGVLCAISPRGNEPLAGVDWYDSGIGFAIPMSDIMSRLERWSAPEDLYPGKLGISPTTTDQFATPVIVARVGEKSPARVAGIEADDVITSVDGRTIRRFPDLQHALNRRYAGEVVTVTLQRGEQTIETEVELAQTIEPLRLTWLGILPELDSNRTQLTVGYVFPEGPAAKAGVKTGDVLQSIEDRAITNYESAALALARFEPEDNCIITVTRDNQPLELNIVLTDLSGQLPEPGQTGVAGDAEIQRFQLEQFPNSCDVVVPAGFTPDGSYGLLVWLGVPGKHDQPELKTAWEAIAARQRVVVIAPHSSEDRRWSQADVEIVNGMIQRALTQYNLSTQKTAVSGEGAGRNLAWLIATDDSRPVQGVGLLGMPVPVNRQLPENQPTKRLFAASWLSERQIEQITESDLSSQLTRAGFPTTFLTSDQPQSEATREELARWLMTLDRL